jgi:hypothetical protein
MRDDSIWEIRYEMYNDDYYGTMALVHLYTDTHVNGGDQAKIISEALGYDNIRIDGWKSIYI